MPAISGSSSGFRGGAEARRSLDSCRRATFCCCFSIRIFSRSRFRSVGLDRFAIRFLLEIYSVDNSGVAAAAFFAAGRFARRAAVRGGGAGSVVGLS